MKDREQLFKIHEQATRGRKNKETTAWAVAEFSVGSTTSGIHLRLVTRWLKARFQCSPKSSGHTDLAMLNKYIHRSQEDMDRAMEWFAGKRPESAKLLNDMLVEFEDGGVRKSAPDPLSSSAAL